MSKRVYIIEPQGVIEIGDNRLVVASSQGEALRIVTQNTFACRVATTLEVAEMIGAGKQLEKSTTIQEGSDNERA
jgi:hypothetical protein